MTNLIITIPTMENCVGTIKSILPQLEEMSKNIYIENDINGPILKTKLNGNPVILCFIDNSRLYENYNNCRVVSTVWPINSEAKTGLFNILTPKALKLVEDFIDTIRIAFQEEYNKH